MIIIKLMENDSDSTTGWNGPMSGYKVSFSGSSNYGVFNEDSETGYQYRTQQIVDFIKWWRY